MTGISAPRAYAAGLTPWTNAVRALPAAQITAVYLTITYVRRKAPTDIACIVEVGNAPGKWTAVPSTRQK